MLIVVILLGRRFRGANHVCILVFATCWWCELCGDE
jgi:hypothetical protein